MEKTTTWLFECQTVSCIAKGGEIAQQTLTTLVADEAGDPQEFVRVRMS